MSRIHTPAVSWYSGLPTRLPTRSSGRSIPDAPLTKMPPWRDIREVKTGSATKGAGWLFSDRTYYDMDISATSNSRCRSIRKKVSSTGRRR